MTSKWRWLVRLYRDEATNCQCVGWAKRSVLTIGSTVLNGGHGASRLCPPYGRRTLPPIRPEHRDAVHGEHDRKSDHQHRDPEHGNRSEVAAFVEIVNQDREHFGL